ncbi:MAG: acyltransferase family protein, partial [Planctomycetota bacterium]
LVAGFFLCVAMGNATKMPGLPRWMVVSPLRYAWLIPLTMIPQAFMGTDGLGFGPATSLGLLPMPQVLLYYSIFFAFGAFYYDAADRDVTLGSRWWITLPVALLIVFPIGLAFSREVSGWGRLVSIATQATYAWLCTFGMMGLFRRVFAKESKTLRYLSDSSYWLYLVHIPLIFIVQYWVRDWQVSALVKFPVVCLVTSGSLLISYHLFVRYTPIGTLLNGPRRRGNTEIAPATPALASHQSG